MTRSLTIRLPLPRAEAMSWFTPEGEREWAGAHWDPHYPAGGRPLGPGLVFTTHAHAHSPTVWVTVDREPTRVRYARVTPEVQAGTVTVELVGSGDRWCSVEVTYDLTALSRHGEEALDRFARGYDEEIRGWQTAIERALALRGSDTD